MQLHIGNIHSFKYKLANSGDPQVAIYDVVGDRGAGQVAVKRDSSNQIVWAKLRLSDGNEAVLLGSPPGPAF